MAFLFYSLFENKKQKKPEKWNNNQKENDHRSNVFDVEIYPGEKINVHHHMLIVVLASILILRLCASVNFVT